MVADFYNYFQDGIDFLISGTTHTVQKILLTMPRLYMPLDNPGFPPTLSPIDIPTTLHEAALMPLRRRMPHSIFLAHADAMYLTTNWIIPLVSFQLLTIGEPNIASRTLLTIQIRE